MKVELSNDAVDELMKSVILQDYKSLCADIKALEQNIDNLSRYQAEDLGNNIRYKQGMEIVLEYYVGLNWKDEL